MDCFAEPVIGRAFARPVGSQRRWARSFPWTPLSGERLGRYKRRGHGRGTMDMLQAEGTEPIKVEFDNFEHGFPEGFGPGGWGYLAYVIGIAFAVFQLYVAAFNYLPSQAVRGIHV